MSKKIDKAIAFIAKELSESSWYKEEEEKEERADEAEAAVRASYAINFGLGCILMSIGLLIALVGLTIFGMNHREGIAGFKRWIMIASILVGGILGCIGFLLMLHVGTLIMLAGIATIPTGIFLFYKGFITSWKVMVILIGIAALIIFFGAVIRGSTESEVRDARREARK
ncbi:hypothetical protein [Pseudobutyrivibrio sp.]|jgi:hypothetical protein|uniref:hypothetical protein n=1 Tax=Pseudobutyrivibrio sp. TaxID=2014367 RepID=UPI0025D6CA77|nr:hypothetical protein [Pseudobutyrivibrio sp.]